MGRNSDHFEASKGSEGVLWVLLGSLGGSWRHLGDPRGSPKSKKLVFLITVVNFKGSLGAARGSTGVPGWWFDASWRFTAGAWVS